MSPIVNILIADDHALVRRGVKTLLEDQGHFKVVAEAKTGEEKDGTLTLKFIKLDPKLEYTLDMLNAEGIIIESIFPNTLFGNWVVGAK